MGKAIPLDHVLKGTKKRFVATLDDGTSRQFKTENEMHAWINEMRPKKEKNSAHGRR